MRCNFITVFIFIFANWFLTPAFADSMAQIPAVSELSDIQPTDWAYEALRALAEKYGCISGYPDRTYLGERSLTRYEFAAGLDSCLRKIEELIISGVNVAREDLTKLQRLSKDFASELTTLQGRVDGLEERVAVLEDNQFSTTTKLSGEVIFAISSAFGDEKADSNESVDENAVLAIACDYFSTPVLQAKTLWDSKSKLAILLIFEKQRVRIWRDSVSTKAAIMTLL